MCFSPEPNESLFYPNTSFAVGKAIKSVNCHQLSPVPVLLMFVVLFCASWESPLGYIVSVVCEKKKNIYIAISELWLLSVWPPLLLYNPLKIENLVELHKE